MSSKFSIPKEVLSVTDTLEDAGFEVYLVGGCVRDLVLEKTPKDWDITTNAKPEQIQELFEETFYENEYGTVGVVNKSEDESLKVVEVTPYRLEGGYSDARRPDSVEFSDSLDDDLKRRDFTINAIAYSPSKNKLIDPYGGQKDLERKVVRAVGDAKERFSEDALRILRAVRLVAELAFAIDGDTAAAIQELSPQLDKISKERIRDEFERIILSERPREGLSLAQKLGVLKFMVPDLERGIGTLQNQAHSFDVFEHNLRALQHAADKKWGVDVRLAALFHDISKPETRRRSEEKDDWTFHGHDVVGARVTRKILNDLRFPKKLSEKVVKLVRWHLFYSDIDQITPSAVRRLIRNVGPENVWDLMKVRVCDRVGTGRPKEEPYRLRKYYSLIDEVMRDPISVGQLAIDGAHVMKVGGASAGPEIGWMLHALLEEVIDDPKKNEIKYLEKRIKELSMLSKSDLQDLGEKGRDRREREDGKEVDKIRKQYWVK